MIILSNRYDSVDIIQEEKERWVISVLIALGMTEDELCEDEYTSRDIMHHKGIEVIDNVEGTIEIIKNKEVIGNWNAPILTLKLDENNEMYYEIELSCNSILDNKFTFSEE